MLIILGGLPATGKTTLAKALATHYYATLIRVDTIEQALRTNWFHSKDIGPLGYQLAYAIAEENLQFNQWVIADSVNSIEITRRAWHTTAIRNNQPFDEIEIICSNKEIHKERAENRCSDIIGLELPTWQAIENRHYEPWLSKNFTIDTATMSLQEAVLAIIKNIDLLISNTNKKE